MTDIPNATTSKVRPPEVVMFDRGTDPVWFRDTMEQAGFAINAEPRHGLVPVYSDRRTLPRICERTGMYPTFCCCVPCRALRRRQHGAACHCWLCYSDDMGTFIDALGGRTVAGRWLWFLTLTFRTPDYPWARGFPIEQPKPQVDFAHHSFSRMVRWIEGQVHSRVDYFFADQFGEVGGRLHLHCGLSWPGLFPYRWKDLQAMLWEEMGFNRILPWKMDAGYYIGRYIGRDADKGHWDFRIGQEAVRPPVSVGRRVIVESAAPNNSSSAYRQTLSGRHR